MTCFHPVTAYRVSEGHSSNGKWPITRDPNKGFIDKTVIIPCGGCKGCRLERARQWAVRCMHEAHMHDDNNAFITLTYSPEHLPKYGSLVKRHFQLFMKKLRKKYNGKKIKYFMCGEYGERKGRPHYHACLFGHVFNDTKLHSVNNKVYPPVKLFTSKTLTNLWGLGHCSVGDVNFASAGYVARYITKKITGDPAVHVYNKIDYSTGEILEERLPEYANMSLRPAIGEEYIRKFFRDIYPHDSITMHRDGKSVECQPPKFYDNIYDEIQKTICPKLTPLSDIRIRRIIKAEEKQETNTTERLRVKKRILINNTKTLIREYEKEIDEATNIFNQGQ